jgi:hypothetical protein
MGKKMLAFPVLFLLLLPHYDALHEKESSEKSLYIKKLTQIYDAVGLDGRDLARRHALMGLLSDELNSGTQTPREERLVLDMEIAGSSEDGGSFEARILTDSLQRSLRYELIRGTVSFETLEIALTSVQKLELSAYAGKRFGKSTAYASFNNGSKGIHELLSLADHTQCKKNVLNECQRGSVVMDPWANQTLAFQRWLQRDLTFDLTQTLGTHNSFNNKADGYGKGDFTLDLILEALSGGRWDFVWAQQWFSMTDQLGMGVRCLMLDPVFFWGKMRLCHCGTTFKWFDDVLDFIEKALNVSVQFDSADLGCMPHDRTLVAGLQEIHDWLATPTNHAEVVMVHLNDESHSSDWGHTSLIQDPVPQIFGNLLFTPLDKKFLFPSRWPTSSELVKLGKRVIVTCTSRCNNSNIFLDMHVPTWDRDTAKYFTEAPECGGFSPGKFYLVGGESQIVGPIYNGPKQEGLIIRENLPYLTQCPVSVSEMDLVSPPLISTAIWTWAPGLSHQNVTSTMCAAVDTEREGRWVVLSCSVELHHMCQRPSNMSDIALSADRAQWVKAQCPEGYVFSLPQTGYVNWSLYVETTKANATLVWINLPPPL